VQEGFKATLIRPYEKIILDGYEIIPLPARHFEGDGAVIYIIKSEGKTLLYGNDTGFFYEEIFDFIEKEKLYFDLISLDCTYADHPVSDSGGHMGIENINRLIGRLAEISAVDEKTEKYLTHFSHKFEPLQQVLETKAARFDLKVAFDGAKIEI
jgi:phosphoribosyl 1,2-cyclic phosphate phosphodiesterase